MEIGEMSLLVQKFGAKNQIPLLDRLWQAESRLERSFSRAQRELERLQKARREKPSEMPAEIEPSRPAEPLSTPRAPASPDRPDFTYDDAPAPKPPSYI